MFNHHPACVFGLRCTGYNFVETVQIEIDDLVIALPSQVDAQSALGKRLRVGSQRTLHPLFVSFVSFVLVYFPLQSPSGCLIWRDQRITQLVAGGRVTLTLVSLRLCALLLPDTLP